MSWRDNTLTAFDLETDSPNPEDARIITACVGDASPSGWKAMNWLLKPERPIPAEATAIHGITTERAETSGTDRRLGILAIRDTLIASWNAGQAVVIYNAVYDLTVLDRELRRMGEKGLRVAGPVIDPLVLDKAVDRYRRGSRKLIDTARHYGIRLDEIDAHGAEADALTAARLAWKIGGMSGPAVCFPDQVDGSFYDGLRPLRAMSLRELHTFQVAAFVAQRLSFIDYRRRNGNPLNDESTDWPLRPAA